MRTNVNKAYKFIGYVAVSYYVTNKVNEIFQPLLAKYTNFIVGDCKIDIVQSKPAMNGITKESIYDRLNELNIRLCRGDNDSIEEQCAKQLYEMITSPSDVILNVLQHTFENYYNENIPEVAALKDIITSPIMDANTFSELMNDKGYWSSMLYTSDCPDSEYDSAAEFVYGSPI